MMGALVTVMVSPKLADGCDVAKDAVAALVADGWTPPRITSEVAPVAECQIDRKQTWPAPAKRHRV